MREEVVAAGIPPVASDEVSVQGINNSLSTSRSHSKEVLHRGLDVER